MFFILKCFSIFISVTNCTKQRISFWCFHTCFYHIGIIFISRCLFLPCPSLSWSPYSPLYFYALLFLLLCKNRCHRRPQYPLSEFIVFHSTWWSSASSFCVWTTRLSSSLRVTNTPLPMYTSFIHSSQWTLGWLHSWALVSTVDEHSHTEVSAVCWLGFCHRYPEIP